MRRIGIGVLGWGVLALLIGCAQSPDPSAPADAAVDAWVFVPVPDAEVIRDAWMPHCPDQPEWQARPDWARDLAEVPTCTEDTWATDCAVWPNAATCIRGRCCDSEWHPPNCFNCLSDADCRSGFCSWGQCTACHDDCDCVRVGLRVCVDLYHQASECGECARDDQCPAATPYCDYDGIDSGGRPTRCHECRRDADCPPARPDCVWDIEVDPRARCVAAGR